MLREDRPEQWLFRAAFRSHLWLVPILLAYLVIGGLFASQTPAWQAPDEPAHYNYVHELAVTGQFPVLQMGDYDEAYLSRLKAQRFPPDLSIASVRYEAHQPPLYYLLAAGVFRLTGGELLPLRLFSLLLGSLFVVLVFEIVRLIYPRQPALRLGAAAFVAFLPMHVAMAASVNNDALAEVVLAALLLLALRYVRRCLEGEVAALTADALLLGLLLGLALITKVSAYVGIVVVAGALAIGWYEAGRKGRVAGGEWRAHGPQAHKLANSQTRKPANPPANGKAQGVDHVRKTGRLSSSLSIKHSPLTINLLLVVVPALLLSLSWYVRNALVYGNLDILASQRHDTVVVGQLRTVELLAQSGLGAVLERFVVWTFDSFWGVFGWMGVWMDGRLYTVLLAFSLAVMVGCARLLIANSRWPIANGRWPMANSRWPMANGKWQTPARVMERSAGARVASGTAAISLPRLRVYAQGLLALSALLTVGIYVSYNLIFVQPQGRYLFPALPAIALAVVLGWREVLRPATARWAVAVLLVAAGGAVAWGLRQGDVNKWSVAILLGVSLALLAWSVIWPRLRGGLRQPLAALAFALPFLALPALDLLALYAFILPQLAVR